MPLLTRPTTQHFLEFAENLSVPEIDDIASRLHVTRLQCHSPVDSKTWELLNENLFVFRPDIELRLYGFHGSPCDLSFVRKLSNVRRFSADCLMTAIGIENVATMEKLDELAVGIYDLESFDFLKDVPAGITTLRLSASKSKKPSLQPLRRFQSLRTLYLEGQQNGIGVLAHLEQLENLTLRSISTPGLTYISQLPGLRSLDIKLGGITDLAAISGKTSIQYLELWQIRGLSDIGVISTLTDLQYLFLQSLTNINAIPDLSQLTNLRRIYLENMKGLKDVDGISTAPGLEQFIHISARNIHPEQYESLLAKQSLREVTVGFGSKQKNQRFESMVAQAGKRRYDRTQFVFQ